MIGKNTSEIKSFIPNEYKTALQSLAKERNGSVSGLVRDAVLKYLGTALLTPTKEDFTNTNSFKGSSDLI